MTSPHVLVLFGASGDLAHRKLFPGLFHLHRSGLLPDVRIIGTGRHSPGTDEEFREKVAPEDGGAEWAEFAERIRFVVSSAEDGEDLAAAVTEAERELGGDDVRRLLYLSVPPSAMQPMVAMLKSTGLHERAHLVLEKPFGRDLASAKDLNATVLDVFDESDVFRIDHFLGKEAAQNILALRFANGLLEPVWNSGHIAYVQIDVPEKIGIEGRASFMEATGTFRDMISTHLFQLLGFVALEPPVHLDADSLHEEKVKVFRAVRPFDPEQVVFGQYEGYRDEDGVADDSTVETFVAIEAYIDNWRWHGVPFLLRTGKAMGEGRRTITLGFEEPPLRMFPDEADGSPNELVLELTDEPEISLEVRAKRPGPGMNIAHARLDLRFEQAFEDVEPLEAYEKLLLDAMTGDHLLFISTAEVERLWELCDPVLADPPPALPYEKGSWGPQEALDLPGERGWRLPEK
ncbi:glucose-6-phosphate dehydrogenase [Pseudonocardia sp.]|jgi:glucose-6-phosphate 1-dehydrogenase|uniref:glucose-6-phosphate dehydrogenase n=1 Tax=Pseudonocardia sp. TaxID=60912 RepID=UPI00261077BA|nr:glucose-6-phosphate dehydrogenase [Pseudonocardia sp.]MCW2718586.1 glucose-6-phosphate dehydrogenase [Pseudonocardia sp.]MDT7612878.1 glucose-6-phosphate 1-dehydrogenase [Pseudonocardiales bacterium]